MEELERLRKNVGTLQKKVNTYRKRLGTLQNKLHYKSFKISCIEDFLTKLRDEGKVTVEELKKAPLSDRQIKELFNTKNTEKVEKE